MQTPARPTFAAAIGRWLIAVVVLALAVSPSVAKMASSRGRAIDLGDLSGTQTSGRSGARFIVKGKVQGLYPGARKPLKLKIINPQRYRIKIKSLKVKVRRSNKPGCAARWIRPKKKVRIKALVPPRARARVSYPVRMPKKAPNSCQGARWVLRYKGKAVRVR